VGGIVVAAIAPHGGLVIEELCTDGELGLAAATRSAMEDLGRRFAEARPDAAVVLTPHNVHVEGAIAVIVAGALEGSVDGVAGRRVELRCPCDAELAVACLLALSDAEVPCVGVSYGGNRPELATMPLDWGALIPLWFMGGRAEPTLPAVLVCPARDLSPEDHVAAGRAVAAAARASGRRIALIASADHGHAHDPGGPYGFHPASAEYDTLMVEVVAENRLDRLVSLEPDAVERAQADSWWQLLMLHGALAGAFEGELLSYEAPTYFGMLCAAFRPRASAGGSRRGTRRTP
jgi:aromatic ring-opening dioxygenase LigB subunit